VFVDDNEEADWPEQPPPHAHGSSALGDVANECNDDFVSEDEEVRNVIARVYDARFGRGGGHESAEAQAG
jgi:hypothetical protein